MLSKFSFGTWSVSIRSFTPFRRAMNPTTSFIRSCAAFQDVSFGRPFLSVAMSLAPPAFASRTKIDANTSSTPPGGFAIPLHSPSSFLSSVSRAASASFTAGSAFARSASADSWIAPASLAITSHLSPSSFAAAACASTMAFSLPTTSAIPSAVSFFSATSTLFTFNSSSMTATDSAVSSSLVNPVSKRFIAASVSARLFSSIVL